MRTVIPFNDDWLFLPKAVGDEIPDSDFERVTLPHTNILLPHHNFDNSEYQFVSTYRKRFALPEPRNGRRVYLDFDGAMIASTVSINGHTFDEYRGGYTPFSFDITDTLNDDGENLLTVRLDSSARKDIPPYGYVIDYLLFGGIYRDVRLRYVEPVHIADVFVRTENLLSEWNTPVHTANQPPGPSATVFVTVRNDDDIRHSFHIDQDISDSSGNYIEAWGTNGASIDLLPGEERIEEFEILLSGPFLWSLDNPQLFVAKVWAGRFAADDLDQSHETLDEVSVRFGLREAHFDKDGNFYLNGEPLMLRGLNRHQTYPYIGAAAPARLQRKDADILKYELGLNIVRTSHYPQSPYFLDRCDEIGLLVFEEIPGWQHIGDEDWQALVLRDVRAMIERDRNHPSIMLWGVRVNESQDDEKLYTATNALAHELDPTRQTGGVRYVMESQFLEDVFTYNDFSNTVLDPIHTPHMITEFNGHMFPTKSWDQEERLIEHGLRHARIQDKATGHPQVAGAIGWCAFDYNTHQEFGSGDRICYHGVSDIFRLPKYAAYFYESQIPPDVRPVLRAATVWSMGDRNGASNDPLVIFSNCDEIEVFVGDESLGRFTPDRETFPNLPHAPYQIPMGRQLTWGRAFADLRLVGYIGGDVVAEQQIASHGLPDALVLEADDAELQADGADMTRLVFKIVDRFGNRLPYTNQVVTFELDGPADLIGENPFALMGGQAALYVKARHEPGTVTVRAMTPRLDPVEVSIRLA